MIEVEVNVTIRDTVSDTTIWVQKIELADESTAPVAIRDLAFSAAMAASSARENDQ